MRVIWNKIDKCHQTRPVLPQLLLGDAQPGPATGALQELVQEMEGVEVQAGVEGRAGLRWGGVEGGSWL